jgi:glutamate formiminotransferase / 5-formyltetrahydrofolate cyclo-ligase
MNPEAIIECVPNFSEGTDAGKVKQIVSAMKIDGVRLLDWSLDTAHNRSVVTIAGSPAAVVEAAICSVGKAAELIDLTRQTGVHPRIGAADVIPFVPVSGVSLAECAMLARQAGLQIWRRYGVPVYFYGAAAARPDRVQLEDVRRGQFEGLREAALRDTARRPDVGGPELHPTAGASAVGARSFLIAYNIYLDAEPASGPPDVSVARSIARDIRASSGGMQGVKAIGVIAKGRSQVSMNITDYRVTSMRDVHAAVEQLARRYGVRAADGELIGLIPEGAYEPDSDWLRQIPGFDPADKVLERRLHSPMAWP